jgi:uncharacterized small protein (DUF1192 family)
MIDTTTTSAEKYLTAKEQARLWLLKDEVELLTANIKRITAKRELLQQEIKRIQTQVNDD